MKRGLSKRQADALEAIRAFEAEQRSWTLRELALALGLKESACSYARSLVQALQLAGYLKEGVRPVRTLCLTELEVVDREGAAA